MDTAKKTPIYNLVILDKSGSMEAIRTEAINGYNETLGSIKATQLETRFEKWVYLLKNMHNMKGIPAEFDEPLFQRLFLLAEIGNFTADEVQQYYNSLSYMGDYDNILNTAKEDAERIGLEKGLEKGRAEGRAEAQLEMARKMLAAGMSVEQIAELTGLTVAQLQDIQ